MKLCGDIPGVVAAPRGNRPVRSLADREGGEVEGATDANHIDKGSLR